MTGDAFRPAKRNDSQGLVVLRVITVWHMLRVWGGGDFLACESKRSSANEDVPALGG